MRPVLIFISVFAYDLTVLGQNNQAFALKLADSLDQLAAKRPLESVYIQTSKEVFERGEDLWFAATVLNRQRLSPSSSSKTLYVEMRAEARELPVLEEMYTLEHGFASGHLFLPDSLPPGTYWLVAFTDHSTIQGEPLNSVRKFLIKDRITPQVYIKTTFQQTAYSEKDAIEGSVGVTSSSGGEVSELRTVLQFEAQGKLLEKIKGKTNASGQLRFKTTRKSFPPGTSLTVIVKLEKYEEVHTTTVPLVANQRIKLSFMPEGGQIISGMTNHVAFKAVYPDGKPAKIKKARLLAHEKEVTTIETRHAGMGRFSFFADGQTAYRIQVLEPAISESFELPASSAEGMQMHLMEKNEDKLVFGVLKSHSMQQDSVHLAVKQRGTVFWMASALLDDNGVILKVPTKDLPQGIVEVTLYNAQKAIAAERLVFVHLDRLLDISVQASQPQFGTKDKVSLKLKVTDKYGVPVQAGLTLSVVDELYAGPFAEKNICSHFLLSNELRGSLFEPAYYFNKDNPRTDEYLDLLMMTQGWRAYQWHFGYLLDLKAPENLMDQGVIIGQIDLKTLSGASKKKDSLEVQLLGAFGAALVYPDTLGKFEIPEEVLMASGGSMIAVQVPGDKKATITFSKTSDQYQTDRSTGHLVYADKGTVLNPSNRTSDPGAIDDIVELQGVEVTARRVTYDKYWGKPFGFHQPSNKDYVCLYNILNCGNHRSGSRPIPGRMYVNHNGAMILYVSPENEEKKAINFVKGHYQIPEFYQPNYEGNPDEKYIPDFRNTLTWEPNLVTDENGEVEVSFFTSDIRSVFYCRVEGMDTKGQFGRQLLALKVLD